MYEITVCPPFENHCIRRPILDHFWFLTVKITGKASRKDQNFMLSVRFTDVKILINTFSLHDSNKNRRPSHPKFGSFLFFMSSNGRQTSELCLYGANMSAVLMKRSHVRVFVQFRLRVSNSDKISVYFLTISKMNQKSNIKKSEFSSKFTFLSGTKQAFTVPDCWVIYSFIEQ